MDTKELISVRQFCKHHNIPVSFLKSLNEIELVEIITTKEELYIQTTQIKIVENSELKATVLNSYFKGSFWLIEAEFEKKSIFIKHHTSILSNKNIVLKLLF